jgi:hypothetical protein
MNRDLILIVITVVVFSAYFLGSLVVACMRGRVSKPQAMYSCSYYQLPRWVLRFGTAMPRLPCNWASRLE